MRYASTPAWVYVLLIGMGLLFIGGGVLGIVMSEGAPAGIVFGLIWLVMGGSLAYFSVRGIRNHADEEWIRRDGTAATATLLAAKKTGWKVGGVPQWALRVRIDGAGATYETTLDVQTHAPPANGTAMAVLIDPRRCDHVVLPHGDRDTPPLEAAIAAAFRQEGAGAAVFPDGSRET